MKTVRVLSLLLLFECLSLRSNEVLWAEDAEIVVLEPIIVSTSRIPSTLSKTSSSTTLMTREDIVARQAATTVELLRHIPGLHIDQAGARGGVSSVYLRGADPNFTVVMIDGIKVNDPSGRRGGAFDFSLLDPDQIESIEIVRGPLSARYGSDSIAGVINIITRGATKRLRGTAELGRGTQGEVLGRLSLRGPLRAAAYALQWAYADDGPPLSGSRFKGTNLQGKITGSPLKDSQLKFTSFYGTQNRESFPDDSGGSQFAVLRQVDQREISEWRSGTTFEHRLNSTWDYQIQADFFSRQEILDSPGVAPGVRDPFGIPPNRSDTTFRRSRFLINSLHSPSTALKISFGAELQYESGKSDDLLFFSGVPIPSAYKINRRTYSGFLETQVVGPQGLSIEGSLRIDDPEHFDAEWSPRLGASYHIATTDTTLKTTWGEGFKLASFFALGNAIVGNPNLVPESSKSFEIGFVQGFLSKRFVLTGSFFHNRFFNLIDLDEGPPPRLVNQSETTTKGSEMALTLQVNPALSVKSHLSYSKTEIKNSNAVLRNRPLWRGGFNLYWQANPKLTSHLAFLYVGKIHDSSIPTGDLRLDGYTRVDINVNWSWAPQWKALIAVDNLLDTRYEEAIGFPAPGIRVRFALRFSSASL
ncbi:hypothetical protein MNBD_NITROSPIRAE01-1411 [hydrothermal vent metagenome]|uniref:TonB-dependent receptor n=1 Tax=hydrothermal vent metagenome TaxID=652676 RepID=A0A3B1D9R4_9ZZZZ